MLHAMLPLSLTRLIITIESRDILLIKIACDGEAEESF